MTNFESFINDYQVQKTLRFELIPQGRTQKNIEEKGFVTTDEQLKQKYLLVKPLIDKLHKDFIDKTLRQIAIDWEPLAEALIAYQKEGNVDNNKNLKGCQEKARKEIVAWFEGKRGPESQRKSQAAYYKKLFGKELFTEILLNSGISSKEIELIEAFKKFTTYFHGYQENRKNFYTSEAKATGIAYRIVNENFSKFITNIKVYQIIKEKFPLLLDKASEELVHAGVLKNQKLEQCFELDAFNTYMTQEGIDLFNAIIGGVSTGESKEKQQGINEIINLAMQQDSDVKEYLKKRPHKMIPLFKQILCDRESLSFVGEQFVDEQDVLNAISEFEKYIHEHGVWTRALRLCANSNDFELSGIFVANNELTKYSQILGGRWNDIKEAILNKKIASLGEKPKKKDLDRVDKEMKSQAFSLQEIDELSIKNNEGKALSHKMFFETLGEKIKAIELYSSIQLPTNLKTQQNKEAIKVRLDAYQDICHMLKILIVDDSVERDVNFYGEWEEVHDDVRLVLPLYNKVRNFATKKPYNLEKFKLNFNIPTLANGWDQNKEQDNGAVLFVKGSKYYLGVLNKSEKKQVDFSKAITTESQESYGKIVYKFFPPFARELVKCAFTKALHAHFATSSEPCELNGKEWASPFAISKEVYELQSFSYGKNDKGELVKVQTKGETEIPKVFKKYQNGYLDVTGDAEGYYQALYTWIDFCKKFLQCYKSTAGYDLNLLKPSSEYKDLNTFYMDVNNLCYKIEFDNISASKIEEWVDKGYLYLFEIYNKDFAPGATGKKNLHTMYWEALFSPENLADTVIKLNGQAELFYRLKSTMEKIVHNPGEYLVNKRYKDGTPIPEDVYKDIYLLANHKINKKDASEESVAGFDKAIIKKGKQELVKDKRFLQDKYLFHVPITLNFKAPEKDKVFDNKVCKFLQDNKNINIIGIDRGERNLIYAVVINQQGQILHNKQISFNKINNYDYHAKLTQREAERKEAKQSWDTVSKIKDLKEGYLSLVVHQIANLMVEYNAIVVMENLNVGFKRMRGGISEKSVYQKFEKMLIDKLNYLSSKEVASLSDVGSVLKSYQLTNKFESFEKMGNQSGFLFYVPAAYTSKIDPVTGFVNVLDTKMLTNKENRKKFITSFDSISYDGKQHGWKVVLDYDKFKTYGNCAKKKWNLLLQGERIIYNSQEKKNVRISPAGNIVNILKEYGVSFEDGKNIIPLIDSMDISNENSRLFEVITKNICYGLQMRNSDNQTAEDYIISPAVADDGTCYNSKYANEILPKDADANGAYHIALKGLYLLHEINKSTDGKRINLAIKNEDWFRFVQEKTYAK